MHERLKRIVRWRELLYAPDFTFCAYYQRKGTCSIACSDERACVTDRPLEGWPSERGWFTRAPVQPLVVNREGSPWSERLYVWCSDVRVQVNYFVSDVKQRWVR